MTGRYAFAAATAVMACCWATGAAACSPPSDYLFQTSAEQAARDSVSEASAIVDAEVVALVHPESPHGYARLRPIRIFKGPRRRFFDVGMGDTCSAPLMPGVRYRVLLSGKLPIYRASFGMNVPNGVDPRRFVTEVDRLLGNLRSPDLNVPGIVIMPESPGAH